MREGGEAPSAGIQSERVEAWGGGRSYDLDTCGRLSVRDQRPQEYCGISVVRSSRHQP